MGAAQSAQEAAPRQDGASPKRSSARWVTLGHARAQTEAALALHNQTLVKMASG